MGMRAWVCGHGFAGMGLRTWVCGHGFADMGMRTWVCGHGYADMGMRTWVCGHGYADIGGRSKSDELVPTCVQEQVLAHGGARPRSPDVPPQRLDRLRLGLAAERLWLSVERPG